MTVPIVIVGIILLLLFVKSSSTAVPAEVSDILLTRKSIVDAAAARNSVPAKRVYAIILHESSNVPNALGTAGERGLMQISLPAFEDYKNAHPSGIDLGFGIRFGGLTWDDMFDPQWNVEVGTWFLGQLLQKPSIDGDINKATQAYNVGYTAFILDNSAGTDYLNAVLAKESEFS